jgi:hypothetical protein
LTAAPGALVLSGGGDLDPMPLAAEIARHFELNVRREEIATSAETLAEAGLRPEQSADEGWWDRRGEREQAIIKGAITTIRGVTDKCSAWFPTPNRGCTIVWVLA